MQKPLFLVMLFVFLAASALLVAGASRLYIPISPCQPYTGPSRTVPNIGYPHTVYKIDNEGEACLDQASPTTLQVHIHTTECFPYNCTSVFERSGEAKVHPDSMTIQLSFRFTIVLYKMVMQCLCVASCGGEGEIAQELMDIMPGTYTVMMGDASVGQVTLPLPINGKSICLKPESTASPVPTPTIATLTPQKIYP